MDAINDSSKTTVDIMRINDASLKFLIQRSMMATDDMLPQPLVVTQAHRETLKGQKSKVVWLTGLPGSGKSTLANALEAKLNMLGRHTYLLDGDNIRSGLNRDLGFSDVDRMENIRRITEVAMLMMDAGLIVLTAFISPFRKERDLARASIGQENFIEVYVSTPLEICERRDPKGLYRKARAGLLANMSGIDSPYEPPLSPQFDTGKSALSLSEQVEVLAGMIVDS